MINTIVYISLAFTNFYSILWIGHMASYNPNTLSPHYYQCVLTGTSNLTSHKTGPLIIKSTDSTDINYGGSILSIGY